MTFLWIALGAVIGIILYQILVVGVWIENLDLENQQLAHDRFIQGADLRELRVENCELENSRKSILSAAGNVEAENRALELSNGKQKETIESYQNLLACAKHSMERRNQELDAALQQNANLIRQLADKNEDIDESMVNIEELKHELKIAREIGDQSIRLKEKIRDGLKYGVRTNWKKLFEGESL